MLTSIRSEEKFASFSVQKFSRKINGGNVGFDVISLFPDFYKSSGRM